MKHSLRKLFLGTTTIVASAIAANAADKELIVFDWSGYEDTGFFQTYIDKHGDSPTFTFFGEEEEAFQKLRAGFKADVSHPCSQSVEKWLAADLIEPLDISKIERWDEVNADMKEAFKFDGSYYFLPADWGTTALTYRTDMVDEAKMNTLEVFLDPEYAGRTAIPDNVDDAYALGYLATGTTDWSKATDDDFKRASDWLRQAHQNVRAYWADGAELAQLLTSGEVIVSWAWNETPTSLQAEDIAVAANRSTKEGSSSWFCGYVNLKNGENSEDKVYDFLNAWMDPSAAEYIVNEWGYGNGNATAMAALGGELLDEMGLGPVDVPVLAQIPMDQALREKMVAEFEKIKAGF
ncbi:polyamine ABC transporter substrate-binding protein [Amylibacter kogurei]|uniref:Polyamine ABC transporter substrate-binding protein n=1 Tax=Paramylibacter kogurei TaxID=1889778 RepID=A0A2G5K8L0_9RHOB|nr:extracellular solute-binding protein [Amylibacter kogurei]PIB25871.1 polyamine ABC transporter substrate-binding protein [Amylibacter kogurei]